MLPIERMFISIDWLLFFVQLYHATPWYMLSSCVCPSIRLSQAGTVPKRLNAGSHKQCHKIAEGLYFSDAKISAKFQRDHNRGAK